MYCLYLLTGATLSWRPLAKTSPVVGGCGLLFFDTNDGIGELLLEFPELLSFFVPWLGFIFTLLVCRLTFSTVSAFCVRALVVLDGRIIPGSKLESAFDVMGEEMFEGLMVVEEDDNGVYNQN